MSVGIKDVARVAQVSPSTVSRVLSGRPVDPAMTQRVREAARALGYRPNLAARRLRSRRSDTIGLIVADIRNPFFTAVSRTIEDIAYAQGKRVILCNTDEDPAKEAMYLQLMQEERATGGILASTRSGASRAAQFAPDFPMVLIDRTGPRNAQDCVVLDNEAMAGRLVEHLHAQGYRRIAGLFGTAGSTGDERRAGFEKSSALPGLAAEAVAVAHGDSEAERIARTLLSRADRPEALVVGDGVMLTAVLRAVFALGLSVPGDVAIAGFDNADWMEFVGGGLTVIAQPVEEIGRMAMTMLLDRLGHPASAPRKIVLAGRFIQRGSTAAIGHRA